MDVLASRHGLRAFMLVDSFSRECLAAEVIWRGWCFGAILRTHWVPLLSVGMNTIRNPPRREAVGCTITRHGKDKTKIPEKRLRVIEEPS